MTENGFVWQIFPDGATCIEIKDRIGRVSIGQYKRMKRLSSFRVVRLSVSHTRYSQIRERQIDHTIRLLLTPRFSNSADKLDLFLRCLGSYVTVLVKPLIYLKKSFPKH